MQKGFMWTNLDSFVYKEAHLMLLFVSIKKQWVSVPTSKVMSESAAVNNMYILHMYSIQHNL